MDNPALFMPHLEFTQNLGLTLFCVPMLHISSFRSRVIALNTLNAEFITLCVKHRMVGKVPKSKDLYKVSLCSNTIVSTCPV